ncbi:MAG: T9SS type A sorting domain-containing protein [Bacteroidota bacterium]
MMHLLKNGYGCIAMFDNWEGQTSHCVFIYEGDGCKWGYKDSWPDSAEFGWKELDLSELTAIYYVTGVGKDKSNQSQCGDYNFAITGDETQSTINYSISGDVSQVCSYTWLADGNIIESGPNKNSIVFDPSNCTAINPIEISVNIVTPAGGCAVNRTLRVPDPPTEIAIQGNFWDNTAQTACPDEVFVANPVLIQDLNYSWQATGVQILGSSNTTNLTFQTPSYAGDFSLSVRAGNICGVSPYETFDFDDGVDPLGSACNGSPLRTAPSTVTVQDRVIHWSGYGISYTQRQEGITCTLVNLNGKEVFRQRLIDVEQRLDVRHLASGLYILSIKGAEFHQREKVFLR